MILSLNFNFSISIFLSHNCNPRSITNNRSQFDIFVLVCLLGFNINFHFPQIFLFSIDLFSLLSFTNFGFSKIQNGCQLRDLRKMIQKYLDW